ncbi:uncharacterized protein LOC127790758 [Diospyros lotus]|uniref:uncharacterized protein LOC127790758 n=1 Tax=Diospyros lotus TaxID=55363 RepID=UPI00225132AE|nr:uncharacterized protein LOC127790758 [Diospyros lotus]
MPALIKAYQETMDMANVSGRCGRGGGGWREMRSFISRLLTCRWFMVFASILIMSVNGATYMFGLYSGHIKSSLGYDQTTLNLVSFFKDLGGNLGLISGLINEITPPWVVLLIGAAMNFSGYFLIWLAVSGRVAKPHVWQICLYIWVGADSQAFANTGSLITCVKSFPASRGIVLGLLKGFVGLSGAIMTQIYHALHGNNSESLILLIGWLPAAVSVLCLPAIRVFEANRRGVNELKIFYNLLYISLCLAGFLMAVIIVQNRLSFSRVEYIGSASIVLLLLFSPLFVIVKEEINTWKNDPAKLNIFSENPPTARPPPGSPQRPAYCINGVFKPPERGEDYTILQALFSVDMVILFVATSCGIGGTLTAIDNLGQIGKSLGYPETAISTFISLISIWNYLGRVAAGFASEIFLEKYRLPRPLLLTAVLLLSCSGHLLIAFAIPNSLYFASVIIGFCFGAQWPLLFAIISDIFGLKYYSTLYQFGAVASPVGAYLLNVKVAGQLYDRQALKQMEATGKERRAGEDLVCAGGECYKLAFVIVTAAALFGCVVSALLVLRTREFYKGDIYKKYREQSQAQSQFDGPTG